MFIPYYEIFNNKIFFYKPNLKLNEYVSSVLKYYIKLSEYRSFP